MVGVLSLTAWNLKRSFFELPFTPVVSMQGGYSDVKIIFHPNAYYERKSFAQYVVVCFVVH